KRSVSAHSTNPGWCASTNLVIDTRTYEPILSVTGRSPRIEERPALAGVPRWRGFVAAQNPFAGVGGIDHVVDLEIRRHVDRLAARVALRHQPLEQCFARFFC